MDQFVVVDLNKAFETVDHNIYTDISPTEANVNIKSHFSKTRNIIAEVPQGSVLCPLLFLVFITTLTNVSPFKTYPMCHHLKHILQSNTALLDLTKKLNHDLKKLSVVECQQTQNKIHDFQTMLQED